MMRGSATTNADGAPRADGLGHGTRRRYLGTLIATLLIVAWVGVAAVGGPYFGRVDEVSTNDRTAYLPASADATSVSKKLSEFTSSTTIPAIVIIESDSGAKLTADQQSALTTAITRAGDAGNAGNAGAVRTSPAGSEASSGATAAASLPVISDDGTAAQAVIPLDSTGDTATAVEAIRTALAADLPAGLSSHVTGPAGFASDLSGAFAGIDGLLLGVALLAVLIILLMVYRSILLPVLVLLTSMVALCAALLTVWWLAHADVLVLTGQTQGILFILVIGAATDYSLLYTSRFAEELRRHPDRTGATRAAWRGTFEPVLASGGTVIAGLLCLLLSDLGSNKSLGPVAALGIVFSMLSALTFLPALLWAFGRAAFWPRRPVYDPARTIDAETTTGIYSRIGQLIARRHRRVWVIGTVALLVAAAGMLQLQANGVPQSKLVLGTSDARDGQNALDRHFPGGTGSPAYVLAAYEDAVPVATTLAGNSGVASVRVFSADSPSGTASFDGTGFVVPGGEATGAGAANAGAANAGAAPTVADGRVMLEATLTDPADSAGAEATVRQLRTSLAGQHLSAPTLIGGVTATEIDTNAASTHDRTLIIPMILLVITLILMLLLRAVIAPLILVVTTVISFAAALGISTLLFHHVLGLPDSDPTVPLYAFVFLVALGIDYTIFLMTRVREESRNHGTREGILRGLSVTGGVITSAGMVLAATFAALAVIPVHFLVQLAVIVSLGVLLDTFVVRTLIVPALTYDVGARIWWPSKLAQEPAPVDLHRVAGSSPGRSSDRENGSGKD